MHAFDLKRALMRYTIDHSGHEPHRDYLGMSQISRDEADLVRKMVTGEQWRPTDDEHAMLYLGRLFEGDVQSRLEGAGLLIPGSAGRELVAGFDSRFRGHIDGIVRTAAAQGRSSEALVEIKCVAQSAMERLQVRREVRPKDSHQVQCYLRHAGLRRAFVVYVSRETGLFYVADVEAHPPLQDALDEKARRVLAAVDLAKKEAA